MAAGIDTRRTTSLVHLNTKIEALNIEHIDYGAVDIEEGRLVVEDATTQKAAIAAAGLLGAGSMYVLINWLDTTAGTSKDEQKDAFDETAPTIRQGTGGLAGLIGNGVPIGIHQKYWDINVNYNPAVGQVMAVGASGKPKNFTVSGANKIEQDRPFFGTIYRLRDGIVWFNFESNGRTLGV
jgi:hypothetical protein